MWDLQTLKRLNDERARYLKEQKKKERERGISLKDPGACSSGVRAVVL